MGSFVFLQEGTGFEIGQTNHLSIAETYVTSFQIARNISSLIISGNTDAFSK